MSYVLVEDVAASWERYEQFAAPLLDGVPEGLVLHAAGRTDEGFRIIEVWESEEAWRRFAAELDDAAPHVVRALVPEHLLYGRMEGQAPTSHEVPAGSGRSAGGAGASAP
jgi:hypothetical protein